MLSKRLHYAAVSGVSKGTEINCLVEVWDYGYCAWVTTF